MGRTLGAPPPEISLPVTLGRIVPTAFGTRYPIAYNRHTVPQVYNLQWRFLVDSPDN
jgi:hypothetical protein